MHIGRIELRMREDVERDVTVGCVVQLMVAARRDAGGLTQTERQLGAVDFDDAVSGARRSTRR
jgi:hypothetical protein